jgi:hypothetical protein
MPDYEREVIVHNRLMWCFVHFFELQKSTEFVSNQFFVLSDILTKHHYMKMYGGVEVQLHAFLTSPLDGGEWLTPRLGPFNPGVRAPGTHWIGGWVGPSVGMDVVAKRKNSRHWTCQESNPSRYNDWATPMTIIQKYLKTTVYHITGTEFHRYNVST